MMMRSNHGRHLLANSTMLVTVDITALFSASIALFAEQIAEAAERGTLSVSNLDRRMCACSFLHALALAQLLTDTHCLWLCRSTSRACVHETEQHDSLKQGD